MKPIMHIKLLGDPQYIDHKEINSIRIYAEDRFSDNYEVIVSTESVIIDILQPSFWKYLKYKFRKFFKHDTTIN